MHTHRHCCDLGLKCKRRESRLLEKEFLRIWLRPRCKFLEYLSVLVSLHTCAFLSPRTCILVRVIGLWVFYNNNNNNNNIISKTMFMVLSSWQSHCESSLGSFDECRKAPSGRRPKTKPDNLGCESACTCCQKLHPPSPFIITQPES